MVLARDGDAVLLSGAVGIFMRLLLRLYLKLLVAFCCPSIAAAAAAVSLFFFFVRRRRGWCCGADPTVAVVRATGER